jgi:hypothetical protein
MKTSILKRLHALEPGIVPEREAWEKIRLAILCALDDFPDAKMAMVEAIRSHPNRGTMEWPELRILLLDCLQPYPAARESVLAALKGAET